MNIPMLGQVKPQYVYAGVGAIGIAVAYGFYKKHKSASTAGTGTSTGIDPNTGLSYEQEYNAEYGQDTSTPYQDQAYQQYQEYGSQQEYSTNDQWASAAIGYAQSDLGATAALAEQTIGDYLRQDPSGLPVNEYNLASELVALLGPPPVGSFRLRENFGAVASGGNPPPTNPPPVSPPKKLPPKKLPPRKKPVPVPLRPGPRIGTYTTRSGDSMIDIASRVFGLPATESGADMLYSYGSNASTIRSEAEKHGITSDFVRHIYPGEVLHYPAK